MSYSDICVFAGGLIKNSGRIRRCGFLPEGICAELFEIEKQPVYIRDFRYVRLYEYSISGSHFFL
jgi:hypothetical protein